MEIMSQKSREKEDLLKKLEGEKTFDEWTVVYGRKIKKEAAAKQSK